MNGDWSEDAKSEMTNRRTDRTMTKENESNDHQNTTQKTQD